MPNIEFEGKWNVYAAHLATPFRPLIPDAKKSIPRGKAHADASLADGNLIIHGDNLHALRALLPRYGGRINCIYIDPLYNTGNEGWCYNDNLNSPLMQRWLQENGAVDLEDEERHDKWLCMMWPRLQLLRELLAEDGAIFATIDDNEQHRLRMVMDEIFGENNFIANIIWRKKTGGGQDSEYLAREHDYILGYRKSDLFSMRFQTVEILESDYPKSKNDRKCKFIKLEKWGAGALRSDRPTLYYSIKDPDGNDFYPQAPSGKEGRWRTDPTALDSDHTHWEKSRNGKRWVPYEVVYFDEAGDEKVVKDRTIFYDLATTTDATNEQKEIFGNKIFDNSKPVDLIRRLIALCSGNDGVVLDSFAGTGTTGHAVLALNQEDGGNRKFILVECEDYADRITAERIRRVIKGVKRAKNENLKNGLSGEFTYCTLGDALGIENMLSGDNLPDYETIARCIAHNFAGTALDKVKQGKDWLFAETATHRLHLIYKPDAKFLESATEAALTFEMAERIGKAAQRKNKEALIFAPHKFMSQKDLRAHKVTFCQLPYSIFSISG